MLGRIVALLFLLAVLAERSDMLPPPVRGPLLWAFRRAESVARAFITGDAATDTPLDASALADSFRALASMLDMVLAQARHVTPRRPGLDASGMVPTLRGLTRPAFAFDTS